MKSRFGLEIRAAANTDMQGLSDLLVGAGHMNLPQVSTGRLDALRQGQGAILIAVEWGPPIGVVVLHWYRTLEADQPTAQITTLLVAATARRRGIGRLLVKTAAQTARAAGCFGLELLTAGDDQALIDFCSASGFTDLGRRFVRPLRKMRPPT